MSLVIGDDVLKASGLTEAELRLEMAVHFYATERLTLGQAGRLAGESLAAFMRVLGSRGVEAHYDVEEFREDLAAVEDLTKP